MPFSNSTLGAVPLNDKEAHDNEKKFCVFSGGKTTENATATAQRSTW